MKKLFGFLVFIVVLVAILVLARNVIAKTAVTVGVQKVTGLNLDIGKFDLGLDSSLDIEDLKLANPKGFEEETMVDLPKVAVAVDLPAILKGKVHVKNINLHLREFQVIRNKDGVLNLDALKPVEQAKEGKVEEPTQEKKKTDLQIDHIKLRIEKVVFRDYSKPITIKKDFNVNIDQEWNDVTDPQQLVRAIVRTALKNTTIGALADINLDSLKGVGSAALDQGKKVLTDAQGQAKEALNQVKEMELNKLTDLGKDGLTGTKNLAEQATGGLKDAAGSLTDTTKGLFGAVKNTVTKTPETATE